MDSFFTILKKHGFKLFLANLVGVIAIVLILIFSAIIIFIAIGITTDFNPSSFQFIDERQKNAPPVLILLLLLFFFVIFASLLALISLAFGGATGVSIEAVANNRPSIRSYFKYSLKYFNKIFGLQLLGMLIPLVICILPFSIAFAIDIALGIGLIPLIIPSVFILFFLVLLAYPVFTIVTINAPVIIIVEKTGVFKSLSLSFRLFMISPVKVFVTFLFLISPDLLTLLFNILPLSIDATNGLSDLHYLYYYLYCLWSIHSSSISSHSCLLLF